MYWITTCSRFKISKYCNINKCLTFITLRCWNCSWLSNYAAEQERLWCGGDRTIKIETVRIMESNGNYSKYFKAMYFLDCMLSGKRIESPVITQIDYEILHNLIQHQLSKSIKKTTNYPLYILDTFHAIIYNKTEIILNVASIETFGDLRKLIMCDIVGTESKDYHGYDEIKFTHKNENLFKPMIFDLFTNCRSIVINTSKTKGNLHWEYVIDMQSLLSLLESLLSEHNRRIKITLRSNHGDYVKKFQIEYPTHGGLWLHNVPDAPKGLQAQHANRSAKWFVTVSKGVRTSEQRSSNKSLDAIPDNQSEYMSWIDDLSNETYELWGKEHGYRIIFEQVNRRSVTLQYGVCWTDVLEIVPL